MLTKLPRTGDRRSSTNFIRVLSGVQEHARFGLGFEGKFYRSGATLDAETLPDPAIALECAGSVGDRRSRETLWILWRFDPPSSAWRELARAQSRDSSWAIALRPLASEALRDGRPKQPVDYSAAAVRVVSFLDAELGVLSPDERGELLSAIEPEICGRIAEYLRASEWVRGG